MESTGRGGEYRPKWRAQAKVESTGRGGVHRKRWGAQAGQAGLLHVGFGGSWWEAPGKGASSEGDEECFLGVIRMLCSFMQYHGCIIQIELECGA